MDLINELQNKLNPDQVLSGALVQARFHHIWKTHEPLKATVVVLPRSTEDISNIMQICHRFDQTVVVHGGLTNLVGGTETQNDDVVISMERMNRIEEVDESSRTMTVQAGVILEAAQQAAQEKDLLLPLNFGAKGSAQIGGIISTNAGGLRVFRFGMTRNLVLGLEVVLADGTIISSLKKIIKDNSAYDLKQLFIGSEGTLGIVTKAILKLSEAPNSRNSAFVGLADYGKVIAFFKFMNSRLIGTLSGFELIWNHSYRAMTSPPSNNKPPLSHNYPFYVLLETLGSNQIRDQEQLQTLLGTALDEHLIQDAIPAATSAELDWFWSIREDLDVLIDQSDNDQHFDISLPMPLIGDYVRQVSEELDKIPEVQCHFPFGHVADGNIHFIIGKSDASQQLIERVNEVVYTPLQGLGGSVSAEHGIGIHKKPYLRLSRSAEEIQLMKTLKHAMDPKGLLNRNKVIDWA